MLHLLYTFSNVRIKIQRTGTCSIFIIKKQIFVVLCLGILNDKNFILNKIYVLQHDLVSGAMILNISFHMKCDHLFSKIISIFKKTLMNCVIELNVDDLVHLLPCYHITDSPSALISMDRTTLYFTITHSNSYF